MLMLMLYTYGPTAIIMFVLLMYGILNKRYGNVRFHNIDIYRGYQYVVFNECDVKAFYRTFYYICRKRAWLKRQLSA